jgi:hypothetical protein
VLPFSPLSRIKKDQKFVWGDEQQQAFNEIKEYMKEPQVLVPPQSNKPFKLYVAADTQTIGSALIQEFEGKREWLHISAESCLILRQGIQPQRSFVVCLLLMYKVSTLSTDYRMRCVFKI